MTINFNNLKSGAATLWQKIRIPLLTLVIVVCLFSAGAAGFRYLTHVDGVVTAVNGQVVTVSNILFNRNVDFEGSIIKRPEVKVGEHIRIMRSISGQILDAQSGNSMRHSMRNEENMCQDGTRCKDGMKQNNRNDKNCMKDKGCSGMRDGSCKQGAFEKQPQPPTPAAPSTKGK